MIKKIIPNNNEFPRFLNQLANDLSKFYFNKLSKKFKVQNKIKGKGYDPVTTADRAFEKFIRFKINKKFPDHEIIGEEYGYKKSKSDFSWVIDPIDGTRSFVIGSPTWSNLISLNYKGNPIFGLANFPILKKYYYNQSDKVAYVVENNKRKKIIANKNVKYKDLKLAAGLHGAISLNKQKKIKKFLNLMQFPCSDALSYAQVCEGKLDVVFQCSNKIWDIHPLIPIIKAAGGVVSTWKNTDAVKGGNIVASANNNIHNKILKMLRPITK